MTRCVCMGLLVLIVATGTASARLVDVPPLVVPRVDGVEVDGEAADWSGRGLLVSVMGDTRGHVRPPQDFTPTLRIGWDARGLLLLAEVRDNIASEHDYDRRLFLKDSLEFFVATAVGDLDYYMLLIAPGVDAKYPQPRYVFFDQRLVTPTPIPKSTQLRMQMSRTKTGGGYRIEVLLPWENLGLVAAEGLQVGFQAYFMDHDGGEGSTYAATLYPAHDTHLNRTQSMYALRLGPADAVATPPRHAIGGEYQELTLLSGAEAAGRTLSVKRGGTVVGQALLSAVDERFARAEMTLTLPADGAALGRLEAWLDHELIQRLERVGPAAMVGQAMREGKLGFYQHVFSGPEFPKVEFQKPDAVAKLIGVPSVRARFFNDVGEEVHQAERPGRYGAVVEVKPAHGRMARRFFTLFRTPDDQRVARLALPYWTAQAGLDVAVGGGKTLKSSAGPALDLGAQAAARRAWQFERQTRGGGTGVSDVDAATSSDAADRAWWVGFKQKFYGLPTARPEFGPTSLDPAAPILRQGSPAEAGLTDDILPAIDALCGDWQKLNGGQGVVLCLARRGVIFYHRAHGKVDGRPMPLDHPCDLASLTKTFTGALIMTFVERGLIDLDEPVDRFVPALRGIDGGVPLTLRSLTTHTSGLSGHWGDDLHDLEEVIADDLPFIERPVTHLYSGVGYALGVKALEMITGEPMPEIYRRVLFEPLGLDHTRTQMSHDGARSTALDVARLGQMLMQRGSYGPWRFFSEKNFLRMKPARLTMILGEETQKTWGIGLWGDEEARGFTPTAFGHGSSSGALLRVDERLDLVLAVTTIETRPYLTSELRQRLLDAVAKAILPGDARR